MSRQCGECSACCVSLNCATLKKAPYERCPKLMETSTTHGCCSIYKARPHECVLYTCAWLEGKYGGEGDRPDKSGAIVELAKGNKFDMACIAAAPGFTMHDAGVQTAATYFAALGCLVSIGDANGKAWFAGDKNRMRKSIWRFGDGKVGVPNVDLFGPDYKKP